MTRDNQFLIDAAERVGSTFLQAFLAALLTTSTVHSTDPVVHVGWVNALLIGLLAGVVSLLTTVLMWLTKREPIANPYVDLFYRAVVTFGQTLLGYLIAAGAMSALDFNWNAALEASAVAAGTALLKGLIGLNSATRGASTLVKAAA